MRKNLIYVLLGVLTLVFNLIACSDDKEDDQTPAVDLVIDSNSVTLLQNDEITVDINSGNGDYYTKVIDDKIATATIINNQIVIKSTGEIGETYVIVIDGRKKSSKIRLQVAKLWDLTVDNPTPELFIGEQTLIKIETGNGGYNVELEEGGDEFISLGALNGQVFTIKALKYGTAKLIITDKKNQSVEILVTVKVVELEFDKYELTLLEPQQESKIKILGGNGDYTFSYDVADVVEARIENNEIVVKGLKAGTSIITVTDAQNESKEIEVIVKPYELSLDKAIDVNGSRSEIIVNIAKGNGGYTIDNLSNEFYTAELNGTKITVKAKKAGASVLTVKDAEGKTLNAPVNIYSMAMNLSLDYCLIANYGALENSNDYKNMSQVTYEVTVRLTGIRGLQGFIGLEGNLLLRGKYDDYQKNNTQAVELVSKLGNTESKLLTQPFIKMNGDWHHIALVFDGTQSDKKLRHKLYVDGVLYTNFDGSQYIESDRTTVDLTQTSKAPGLGLGRIGEGSHRGLNGQIGEARVWSVARTADQIKNNVCDLNPSDRNGLISHWKFDYGTGNVDAIDDLNGTCNAVVYSNNSNSVENKITFPTDQWVSFTCPPK